MKCIKCGAEIKDGAKFCTVCGAQKPVQQEEKRFCKACGAPLKPGGMFCTACGAKVDEPGQQGSPAQAQQHEVVQSAPAKKKSAAPIVIAVAVVCVVVAVAAALMFAVFAKPKDAVTASQGISDGAGETSDMVEEVAPAQIESNDADIVADGTVSLTGVVEISTDNRLFLDFGEAFSIMLKQDDAWFKMNDVQSAYLLNSGVSSSLWDELPLPQTVLVKGELRLDGSELYLEAQSVTNPDGSAVVTQAEQAAPAESPEILSQSDDRILTERDVSDLSLQEINYAKNEIYARHGRRFQSKELQDYFNAQSWYRGTVDAEDFSESWLSDIEKKNAEFLAEVEFDIAPNGYQLDQ